MQRGLGFIGRVEAEIFSCESKSLSLYLPHGPSCLQSCFQGYRLLQRLEMQRLRTPAIAPWPPGNARDLPSEGLTPGSSLVLIPLVVREGVTRGISPSLSCCIVREAGNGGERRLLFLPYKGQEGYVPVLREVLLRGSLWVSSLPAGVCEGLGQVSVFSALGKNPFSSRELQFHALSCHGIAISPVLHCHRVLGARQDLPFPHEKQAESENSFLKSQVVSLPYEARPLVWALQSPFLMLCSDGSFLWK